MEKFKETTELLLQGKFKKGDRVKLPFNETGTVVRFRDFIWGNNYDVRIRKATLSKTNEIADFKEEDMELE